MKVQIGPTLIAGLSNVVLAPLGYFFAGAWRTGVAACLLIMLIALLLFQWSLASPPGVYGLRSTSIKTILFVLAIAFGLHAAWLRARRSPMRPLALRLAAGLSALVGLFVVAMTFRAFWPVSIYSVATSSLEPRLHKGDIVAVRGARIVCGRSRPVRGNVVIVAAPELGVRLIRGVIAGPGQQISTRSGAVKAGADTWILADNGAPSGYRLARIGSLCGIAYRTIRSSEPRLIGGAPAWN